MIRLQSPQFLEPHTGPTTPQKGKGLAISRSPLILKAYTEVVVSWDTTDQEGGNVTIKGFIDYGVSYAQKTPEALEAFFVVVETKPVGNTSGWASYMGLFLFIFGCALLIMEKELYNKNERPPGRPI